MRQRPTRSPRRRRRLRASAHRLSALLAALVGLLVGAPTADAQLRLPRAPVVITETGEESTIVADQIQQIGGPSDLMVATGNVEITQGASRLSADRVEVNRDTGEVVAQGRVVFYDGKDRFVGDRVDYNLRTGTGVVYNGTTSTAPYYHLSGERMERVGDGVYRVRQGTFTTCEGEDPAWSFRFGDSTADLNEAIYGTGASFWVKNIPLVPFIPFFGAAIRRERQTGFLFPEVGSSSQRGLFSKIPFFWAINDSQDLTVAMDTYTRRGIGVEGEYRYIWSERQRGTASGFLLPEFLRNPEDRQRLDIPELRGYGTAKHDWQITPRLALKVDAQGTTDDLVLREYGDRLGDRARQRAETNVFVAQRWDTFSATANVLWYQDLTTPAAIELQRVPEIKLFGVRQPIPGLRGFLYETESSFTNFIRDVGDGGARLDFHARAFYPIPLAGLFTVTPFAGPRFTYYNTKAVGTSFTKTVWVEDTVHEDRVRRQVEGGVEVETRASRVWDMGGRGGLAALQHVVEPRATYLMIRGFDQKANPQYDPAIDDIGRVTRIIYSLTNRLNAKTVASATGDVVRWEAARLTVAQAYDIDRQISHRQPFRDMQAEFIVDPNNIFRFRADASYNMYDLGLRFANADLIARFRDWGVSLGSRYNAISNTNFVVGEATARITNNIDTFVSTNWDVAGSTLLEQRVGIDWRFQCFAITAEYILRHQSDNEFRFAVNLLGIGQVGTKVGP